MQDFDVLVSEGLFLFCTLLEVLRQGVSSSIGFALTIINLEVVMKEFLSLANLSRAQTLCIHEPAEYNNVTLGAEGSRSGSHVTTIIQNFTLVSSTSTTTPHRVWLPFGASGPFLDLRTRSLLTSRTRPLIVYAIKNGRTSMRNGPLWYYLQVVYLLRHEARSSSDVT